MPGKKLSDEEERLLAEFEQERSLAKKQMESEVREEIRNELADEVREVMEKEVHGGIDDEVQARLKEHFDLRKKVEEDLRKQIEEETKEKLQQEIEEKLRKEIEERERLKKEELLQKIQALKKLEEEKEMWAEEIKKEAVKELEKNSVPKEPAAEEKKETEEEMKKRLKEELLKEIEEERKKKKEALLQKLSGVREAAESTKPAAGGLGHDEKVIILQLFEESQRMMNVFLVKRLNRQDVDAVYVKTLEKAAEKFPDVLRKTMYDMKGDAAKNGAINTSRAMSNVNSLPLAEDKKPRKMFEALKFLFEERVIQMELKTSPEIKNQVIAEVLDKMKKSMERKQYAPKIQSIFLKQIMPDTALPQGR